MSYDQIDKSALKQKFHTSTRIQVTTEDVLVLQKIIRNWNYFKWAYLFYGTSFKKVALW